MTFARIAGGDEAGWPWSHRKTFLERLRAQGYSSSKTLGTFLLTTTLSAAANTQIA